MLHILTFLVLIGLSAFFSGSETALFSLTGFQKKRLQSKNPARSKIISILLESPRRTLATILIGNMLVNITATSVLTIIALALFGEKGVGIAIVLMTFIVLVFGEVTPKTYAIRDPEGFSSLCSKPLHIFGKIIWPLRRILRLVSDIFISFFVIRKDTKPYITQKELKALMTISKKEGIIEREEEEMIHSLFNLGERSVDEIMTPRVDIIGCEKTASISELKEIMKESKHTKIPIFEETIDSIVGIVYTIEFMLKAKDDFTKFIKKPLYVPETERMDNLLLKFLSQKVYIAVVLDEFGGTSGLVTLEDVLEEIVGEITDEYDKEIVPISREKDNSYTVVGKTSIRDVNEELNLNLPMEEVTTINGLLLLLFGRVPKSGERIRFKGVIFRVVEVKNNMVMKVSVFVSPNH
ncbi:CNNM domain-containing protein [Candidatus Omnitrophota bacterium]